MRRARKKKTMTRTRARAKWKNLVMASSRRPSTVAKRMPDLLAARLREADSDNEDDKKATAVTWQPGILSSCQLECSRGRIAIPAVAILMATRCPGLGIPQNPSRSLLQDSD